MPAQEHRCTGPRIPAPAVHIAHPHTSTSHGNDVTRARPSCPTRHPPIRRKGHDSTPTRISPPSCPARRPRNRRAGHEDRAPRVSPPPCPTRHPPITPTGRDSRSTRVSALTCPVRYPPIPGAGHDDRPPHRVRLDGRSWRRLPRPHVPLGGHLVVERNMTAGLRVLRRRRVPSDGCGRGCVRLPFAATDSRSPMGHRRQSTTATAFAAVTSHSVVRLPSSGT